MSTTVDVLSRTQRIVVDASKRLSLISPNRHVHVINSGPQGPAGPSGTNAAPSFAEGQQTFPSETWIMNYDLGGKPAAFRFFDENGQEWEPEDIVYVNPTRAIAQWPDPMMGSWLAS